MGRRKKNFRKPATVATKDSTDSKSSKTEPEAKSIAKIDGTATTDDRTPIDVYARLSYPLVRIVADVESADEASDDEETIEISFRPRLVFASSLCLVCLEPAMIVCETCRMVSYCSIGHRDRSAPGHRVLCQVLTEICAQGEGMRLAKDLDAQRYRIYRMKMIETIERALGRSLDLWEREIVLYPRVCRACREFSEDLVVCPVCKVDYFCRGHEASHRPWCREFQVFRRILSMQRSWGQVDPQISTRSRSIPVTLPEDFDLLTAELYDPIQDYYRAMDCHTYSTLSHLVTCPLTALYALQKSLPDWRDRRDLVVHVAGAEYQFECSNLRVWETFLLHLLPNLRALTIVLIGPELRLPPAPPRLLARVKTCRRCRVDQRKVRIRLHPGVLYHDYVASRDHLAPDLVCLYNPGLYRRTGYDGTDTWPATIDAFLRAGSPVLVTSYTEREIPREVERIASTGDVDVVVPPRRNPYASLRPDRNFVSDDEAPLIYKNYFLTVVKPRK